MSQHHRTIMIHPPQRKACVLNKHTSIRSLLLMVQLSCRTHWESTTAAATTTMQIMSLPNAPPFNLGRVVLVLVLVVVQQQQVPLWDVPPEGLCTTFLMATSAMQAITYPH